MPDAKLTEISANLGIPTIFSLNLPLTILEKDCLIGLVGHYATRWILNKQGNKREAEEYILTNGGKANDPIQSAYIIKHFHPKNTNVCRQYCDRCKRFDLAPKTPPGKTRKIQVLTSPQKRHQAKLEKFRY